LHNRIPYAKIGSVLMRTGRGGSVAVTRVRKIKTKEPQGGRATAKQKSRRGFSGRVF
jgi:hypothetical protein